MGPASPATFGGAPQIRRICIAPGVRNLPPRTTGSVARIEQCVCHWSGPDLRPKGGQHMSLETDLIAEKHAEAQS